MEEKKKFGRPRKDPMRGHQIRFGRLSDDLTMILQQFESEKDKQLVIGLLESLKPKNKYIY